MCLANTEHECLLQEVQGQFYINFVFNFQVAKAYLEIFELPEVQGVLFFQTVVNHVSSINKE